MATFRCDGGVTPRLRLPLDADADEAAVIVAAIRRLIADEEADGAEVSGRPDRWRLTGRLESVTGRRVTIAASVPDDPWVAAGRIRR
ncbi:MAG: acc operon protein [Halobacteriota archaeon]